MEIRCCVLGFTTNSQKQKSKGQKLWNNGNAFILHLIKWYYALWNEFYYDFESFFLFAIKELCFIPI